ncbi:Spc98 family-domain-containing protein [Dichotomopilus funicola]|uniref:Spindle pole body component n=1 Tax=Dichotomopilus funicola TaxID=1934379 RepID=A0AAN6ZQW9_9PEZI|nr:Spc98 family-domain-containing protein [Dichotomopilus funicola]
MADEEDPSDLFAVPDFWRPSNWLDNAVGDNTVHSPLFVFKGPSSGGRAASDSLIDTADVRGLGSQADGGDAFFKLPSLLKELADQEPALPIHPQPNGHRVELPESELDPPLSSDDEDFWISHAGEDIAAPSTFRTWENFNRADQDDIVPSFVSEAGPSALDALFAAHSETGHGPDVIDTAIYCACLRNLALGRSSALFSWSPEKESFIKTVPHLRISGLSLDSVRAVDKLCLDCGNSLRYLQDFSEEEYSAAATPVRVALAGVVDRLVRAVRSELSDHSYRIRSVLQLQSSIRPAQSVLSYFDRLIRELARQKSDEGLLSCLYEEAQTSEYRDGLLKDATREVLRVLSDPWTAFVEEWIGLRAEGGIPVTKTGPGKAFVMVADRMWIDDQGFELEDADYFLDGEKVPTFIPKDMARVMFETGRDLRFLREHHPDHILSQPDISSLAIPPRLGWEFDWESVSKLEARVNEYRDELVLAIQQGCSAVPRPVFSGCRKRKYDEAELEYFGKDENQVEANILASIRQLDQPLQPPKPRDALTQLLRNRLYQTDAISVPNNLTLHWTLVPLLSFGPAIEVQSTLIGQECMKLIFTAHHIRDHIDLFKQYFLLGNGLLVSRLTHALFNPDLATAERRTGVALGTGTTMGLRLMGRKTWPPASSELRLALMGVLSDCYEVPAASQQHTSYTTDQQQGRNDPHSLLGDLSFSVRDLSPEEIDRCMDPHKLEALDFLRLSYKSPAPLRPILSPAVLLKYDHIFKLLMRVLRMLYVANQLLSPCSSRANRKGAPLLTPVATRFQIEARHFIHQIAGYFFDVGIRTPWANWEAWLDRVEEESLHPPEHGHGNNTNTNTNIKNRDRQEKTRFGGTRARATPEVLRDRHERLLDEIMGALLLRKRQAPVMALLEETFAIVLQFAAAETEGPLGKPRLEQEQELYRQFRKKVSGFVTVCRALREKMAVSASGGREEGVGSVEQLLVRLDLEGFYARGDDEDGGW